LRWEDNSDVPALPNSSVSQALRASGKNASPRLEKKNESIVTEATHYVIYQERQGETINTNGRSGTTRESFVSVCGMVERDGTPVDGEQGRGDLQKSKYVVIIITLIVEGLR
jgi:hypothetical protein